MLLLAGSDPGRGSGRQWMGARNLALSNKAFLPLRGRLVVEHVLDWLRETGLDNVWLVAPESQLRRIGSGRTFTPVPQRAGARFLDSLTDGLAAMTSAAGEPVLVVFGDHPVTSAAALSFFLERCAALLHRADLFHALATQAAYQAYGPWFRRTSIHTREARGRASGLTLVVPSRVHGAPAIGSLYAVRKLERPAAFLGLLRRLARWIGPDAPRAILDSLTLYLAKEMEKAGRAGGAAGRQARRLEDWLAGRVPLERLERWAARVLQAERGVRVIPVAHGGIALDVDFAWELQALEDHWEEILDVSARQDAALVAGRTRPPLSRASAGPRP